MYTEKDFDRIHSKLMKIQLTGNNKEEKMTAEELVTKLLDCGIEQKYIERWANGSSINHFKYSMYSTSSVLTLVMISAIICEQYILAFILFIFAGIVFMAGTVIKEV